MSYRATRFGWIRIHWRCGWSPARSLPRSLPMAATTGLSCGSRRVGCGEEQRLAGTALLDGSRRRLEHFYPAGEMPLERLMPRR